MGASEPAPSLQSLLVSSAVVRPRPVPIGVVACQNFASFLLEWWAGIYFSHFPELFAVNAVACKVVGVWARVHSPVIVP
eukprot:7173887-Prymnesium_polylepis.1